MTTNHVPNPYDQQLSRHSFHETMIWCAICKAAYAPSPLHASLPQTASLESTFLSMCHFCFRCRRPACPDCWDEVHGICGVCVQDVYLPFRTTLTPLDGTAPVPSQLTPSARVYPAQAPLVCVRPGRFQIAVSLPIDRLLAEPVEIIAAETDDAPSKNVQRLPSQNRATSRRGLIVILYVLLLLIIVLIIVLTLLWQHASLLVTPRFMVC